MFLKFKQTKIKRLKNNFKRINMANVIVIIFATYIIGAGIACIIGLIIADSNWKYAEGEFIIVWPALLYLLPHDFIKYTNNYLNKNNLKQMNFKILGKAMGFMFLPTLGVLLMLLVGFFDPIQMWNWIKSDSAWAIIVRIFIFVIEISLITYLYFDYLEEEINENIKKETESDGTCKSINYSTYARDMFDDASSSDKYILKYTKNPNVVIIERKKY